MRRPLAALGQHSVAVAAARLGIELVGGKGGAQVQRHHLAPQVAVVAGAVAAGNVREAGRKHRAGHMAQRRGAFHLRPQRQRVLRRGAVQRQVIAGVQVLARLLHALAKAARSHRLVQQRSPGFTLN